MARTVLIVDDHEGFRDAARQLLTADGFVVVGDAVDGHDAIEQADRLAPDIVLLDIQLPDIDGFAVADQLACTATPPLVVLISSRDAITYGARLQAAPTSGFLSKRELSGATLSALLG